MHTSGKVSKFHNKTYLVKATSKKEAQEIAKQSFQKEFNCNRIDAETQSYARTKCAIAACILMSVAILISFFNYPYEDKFLFFFSREKIFSFAPDMISTLYAIVFYLIYAVRFKGIKRTIETPIDIAFAVLSILLLSSVFQLILRTKELKILGFVELPDSQKVLIITILASLLGVKLVSAICMVFIAFTTVSNLSAANEAMEFWGVIYVMCAFFGIILSLSVEPAILEAVPQIKNSFANTFKNAEKDFLEAKSEAKTLIDKLPKK